MIHMCTLVTDRACLSVISIYVSIGGSLLQRSFEARKFDEMPINSNDVRKFSEHQRLWPNPDVEDQESGSVVWIQNLIDEHYGVRKQKILLKTFFKLLVTS